MVLFADAGPDRTVVLPSRIVSAVMPISVWGGGPAGPPQAAMVTSKAANAANRLTKGGHGTREEERGRMRSGPFGFCWWSYGRPSWMVPKGSQWSVVHLMVCSWEMGNRCVFEVCTLIPGRTRKLSDSFIWLAAMSTMFARVRLVPAFRSTATTEKAKAMPATQKLSANWQPFPYLSRSVLYWAMPASLVNSLLFGSFRYRAEIMPSTGDELPTFLITDRQVVVLAATWFI